MTAGNNDNPLVLVVGGAGYIGAHMAKRLREAGFAVAVADDLSSGRREAVPRCTNAF